MRFYSTTVLRACALYTYTTISHWAKTSLVLTSDARIPRNRGFNLIHKTFSLTLQVYIRGLPFWHHTAIYSRSVSHSLTCWYLSWRLWHYRQSVRMMDGSVRLRGGHTTRHLALNPKGSNCLAPVAETCKLTAYKIFLWTVISENIGEYSGQK